MLFALSLIASAATPVEFVDDDGTLETPAPTCTICTVVVRKPDKKSAEVDYDLDDARLILWLVSDEYVVVELTGGGLDVVVADTWSWEEVEYGWTIEPTEPLPTPEPVCEVCRIVAEKTKE